jgi:hypothetical protein
MDKGSATPIDCQEIIDWTYWEAGAIVELKETRRLRRRALADEHADDRV